MTNDDAFLFGMLLNHLIVFAPMFHWLTFVFPTNALLILSRVDLLIFPISDLERLINQNFGKSGKLSQVNRCKNIWKTIKWFKSIPNKKVSSFVNFDVENFYPSISEKLLTHGISYAKSLTDIAKEQYLIVTHSKKTLRFQNTESQVKKDGNRDFDVPIGCQDRAEICELVGSFILNRMGSVIVENEIRLFRDDSLEIFCEISKSMIERKKKLIVKTFKQCRLAITVEFNLKTVNFFERYI